MLSPVKIWRNQIKIQKLLGIKGQIISWTKVHVPPIGFADQAPYVIAVVRLENGQKYTAQLVDYSASELNIGQEVVTVLRKTRDPGEEGVIPYGIKFKPLTLK